MPALGSRTWTRRTARRSRVGGGAGGGTSGRSGRRRVGRLARIVRLKFTCAWRLRPLSSWPWVSRRLSWATTRGPWRGPGSGRAGSARSSSFRGRLGGRGSRALDQALSSSRRRCCSSVLVGPDVAARGSSSGRSGWGSGLVGRGRGVCVDVRRQGHRSPRRGRTRISPGGREVPERGVDLDLQRCGDLLAERVEIDLVVCLSVGLCDAPFGDAAASGLGLGGAEEEALEHEIEHAAIFDLASVAASASLKSACLFQGTCWRASKESRISDVPTARPSSARSSANRSSCPSKPSAAASGDLGVDPRLAVAGVSRRRRASSRALSSLTPTRAATVSRSAVALDDYSRHRRPEDRPRRCHRRRAAAARAPSRSTRRSRRLLEVERGTMPTISDELPRDRLRQLGRVQADDLQLALDASDSRATGTGSGA